MFLQLVFLLTKKPGRFIVEILRQYPYRPDYGECIRWKAQTQLGSHFRRIQEPKKKNITNAFGHGLIFDVNLRLDFCAKGEFFSPQTKPDT